MTRILRTVLSKEINKGFIFNMLGGVLTHCPSFGALRGFAESEHEGSKLHGDFKSPYSGGPHYNIRCPYFASLSKPFIF